MREGSVGVLSIERRMGAVAGWVRDVRVKGEIHVPSKVIGDTVAAPAVLDLEALEVRLVLHNLQELYSAAKWKDQRVSCSVRVRVDLHPRAHCVEVCRVDSPSRFGSGQVWQQGMAELCWILSRGSVLAVCTPASSKLLSCASVRSRSCTAPPLRPTGPSHPFPSPRSVQAAPSLLQGLPP